LHRIAGTDAGDVDGEAAGRTLRVVARDGQDADGAGAGRIDRAVVVTLPMNVPVPTRVFEAAMLMPPSAVTVPLTVVVVAPKLADPVVVRVPLMLVEVQRRSCRRTTAVTAPVSLKAPAVWLTPDERVR